LPPDRCDPRSRCRQRARRAPERLSRLDGLQLDDGVRAASEEVDLRLCEIRGRINPAFGGEFLDAIGIDRGFAKIIRKPHTVVHGLGRQRPNAIVLDGHDGAPVEAARGHRRAHDVGRMGDIDMVGHEGARRNAGKRTCAGSTAHGLGLSGGSPYASRGFKTEKYHRHPTGPNCGNVSTSLRECLDQPGGIGSR